MLLTTANTGEILNYKAIIMIDKNKYVNYNPLNVYRSRQYMYRLYPGEGYPGKGR